MLTGVVLYGCDVAWKSPAAPLNPIAIVYTVVAFFFPCFTTHLPVLTSVTFWELKLRYQVEIDMDSKYKLLLYIKISPYS
jgi:hypothetical protein